MYLLKNIYKNLLDDFSRNQGKDSETVVSQQDEFCQPTNLEVYIKEWNELYSSNVDIPKLKKKALNGELRSSLFRSICWRCLLGILHGEPKQWLMELKTHRSHYSDLWVELHKNPWNVERSPSDNPLSQEAEVSVYELSHGKCEGVYNSEIYFCSYRVFGKNISAMKN